MRSGEPQGLCAETASKGVWRREWSHATVEMDCNSWSANITMKSDDGESPRMRRQSLGGKDRLQSPPGSGDCPCTHCMDANPCAPPACQQCGPGPCHKRYGCATNASAACTCTRSWPSGKGCNYSATSFVHWVVPEDYNGCCQMPAAWMTEPHDSGGNRVAPLPFPASQNSWGSACDFDEIPQSARFANGSCASVGFTKKEGDCLDSADCDCSTSWISLNIQCARSMADACEEAKRASASTCLACCGRNQQSLKSAGCTEANFSAFCHAPRRPSSDGGATPTPRKTDDGDVSSVQRGVSKLHLQCAASNWDQGVCLPNKDPSTHLKSYVSAGANVSIADCCAMCAGDERCQSWSSWGGGKCRTFSAIGPREELAGCTSGATGPPAPPPPVPERHFPYPDRTPPGPACRDCPNIVFALTDDQDVTLGGWTPMRQTQELIQKKGATLTEWRIHTPICSPSRSETVSGRYFHNIKNYNVTLPPPVGAVYGAGTAHINSTHYLNDSFGVHLRQQKGYRVGMFGKSNFNT